MKKFLLPILGLLFCGTVGAQTSQQVTVRYFDYISNPEMDKEVFEPTTNTFVSNGDGAYVLENYMNSGYNFDIVIKNGAISFPKFTSSYGPIPGDYMFHLKTVDTYPSFVNGGAYIQVDATGKVNFYTARAKNNAKLLEEKNISATEKQLTYEVTLATSFSYRIPNGEKEPGSDPVEDQTVLMNKNYCVSVFEFSVVEQREGKEVSYLSESGAEIYQKSLSAIESVANSVSVDFFAGSNAKIEFTANDTEGNDGKYPLTFTEGVKGSENAWLPLEGATFSLKNPDGTAASGTLSINPGASYAKLVEGSNFKIYIASKFGENTGYAVFDVTMTFPKGELRTFTVTNNGQSTALATYEWYMDIIDDKHITIYNFMNSGYNIPIELGIVDEKDNPLYVDPWAYKTQTVAFEGDYGKVAGRITLPDGEQFTANVLGQTFVNPQFYFGSNSYYGVVRVKDGDGFKDVRKELKITFGANNIFYNIWQKENLEDSGIADIVVDEDVNAPVEWYNLQGVRMNGDNLAPGIYIKRQGLKATKVLVK